MKGLLIAARGGSGGEVRSADHRRSLSEQSVSKKRPGSILGNDSSASGEAIGNPHHLRYSVLTGHSAYVLRRGG